MNRFIVLAVFASIFITTSAQATDKGMYVSANVGVSILSDSEANIPGVINAEISYDIGPLTILGGALGYNFGDLRAEGEITFRTNDTDTFTSGGTAFTQGEVSALSFMVNGFYDFHTANSSLVPYLGVGMGVANIDADVTAPSISSLALVDDNATVFAYQLMAGLGYKIGSATTITIDYRYFATSDPEFSPGPAFVPGLPDVESEYSNHSFNLGVRVAF